MAGNEKRRRGGVRPGAGRPRRAELDARILEAALTRLRSEGYEAMRVEAVAAEAGVAKTTIYRRWPSKAALAVAAVHHLYLDRISPVDTGGLRADLVTLMRTTYQFFIKGPGAVLEDLLRSSGQDPDLAELIHRTTSARREAYYQLLNRAVTRGELPPGIDHDVVVDLLLGPLWTRLLITGRPVADATVEKIVDIVLEGLALKRA